MSLSKLSLSKNKAAKRQSTDTPGTAIKSASATSVRGPTPEAAPAIHKAPARPTRGPAQGQGRQAASSFPRLLDSDDGDWDSDTEPSQPPRAGSPPPSTAGVAAGRGGGQGGGHRTAGPAAAAPAAQLDDTALAAQPRLSEIYDLDAPSDEEREEQHAPSDVPAIAAAAAPGPSTGKPPPAGSLVQPQLSAGPAQQLADCKQPQHRKRSFDQEAAKLGAAAASHRPAAAPVPPATSIATATPRVLQVAAPAAPSSRAAPQAMGSGQPASPSWGPSSGQPAPGNGGQQNMPDADLPEYQEVRAWLQGLQLEQFFRVFVREEIDLTIVHALTAEDLAGIGITQRVHQQALVDAGQKLGAARRATQQQQHQRQRRHQEGALPPGMPPQRSVAGHQQARTSRQPPAVQRPGWGPLLAQPQQQLQQAAAVAVAEAQLPAKARVARGSHQSLLQAWQANSAAQAAVQVATGTSGAAGDQVNGGGHAGPWQQRQQLALLSADQAADSEQQHASLAGLGTRPKERALLAMLYPAPGRQAAHHAQQQQQQQRQQPATPVLRPSMVGGAGRVPAGAMLWDSAGECRPVAPGMEARLARRRAEAGLDESAPAPPLARGGTAYPQVDESRALRLLKLQALRQELAMHEETVAELRKVIAGMEAELSLQ